MNKKILVTALLAFCILLSACSKPNDFGLSLAVDGNEKLEIIFTDEERMVFVFGGIMTAELDGESKMLDVLLYDGTITVNDILSTADTDAEDGDIETTEYPDGSIEYHYNGFDLVHLKKNGIRDVYFIPSDMSYYDIAH